MLTRLTTEQDVVSVDHIAPQLCSIGTFLEPFIKVINTRQISRQLIRLKHNDKYCGKRSVPLAVKLSVYTVHNNRRNPAIQRVNFIVIGFVIQTILNGTSRVQVIGHVANVYFVEYNNR